MSYQYLTDKGWTFGQNHGDKQPRFHPPEDYTENWPYKEAITEQLRREREAKAMQFAVMKVDELMERLAPSVEIVA